VLDDCECKLLIPSLSLTTEDFVGGVKLEMSRVIDTPHYLRGLVYLFHLVSRVLLYCYYFVIVAIV
jgi:hypothetical protein